MCLVDQNVTDVSEMAKIRQECINEYGLQTRRYARKQRRWLKNRISKSIINDSNEYLKIIRFDTSNKEKWNEQVLTPATQIVVSFLNDKHDHNKPKNGKSKDNNNNNGEMDYVEVFKKQWKETIEFINSSTTDIIKNNNGGFENDDSNKRGYYSCNICDNQEFHGLYTYNAHIVSKRHKKRIQNMKRQELNHFKKIEKRKAEYSKIWKPVFTF